MLKTERIKLQETLNYPDIHPDSQMLVESIFSKSTKTISWLSILKLVIYRKKRKSIYKFDSGSGLTPVCVITDRILSLHTWVETLTYANWANWICCGRAIDKFCMVILHLQSIQSYLIQYSLFHPPASDFDSQKILRREGIILGSFNHGLKLMATQKTTGNPDSILPHVTLNSKKIPRREGIIIKHFDHGLKPMATHGSTFRIWPMHSKR